MRVVTNKALKALELEMVMKCQSAGKYGNQGYNNASGAHLPFVSSTKWISNDEYAFETHGHNQPEIGKGVSLFNIADGSFFEII